MFKHIDQNLVYGGNGRVSYNSSKEKRELNIIISLSYKNPLYLLR